MLLVIPWVDPWQYTHLPLLMLVVVDAYDDQPSKHCYTSEHLGALGL